MICKPYPAYKPSGVEWIGNVPEGWSTKRLKRVVRLFDRKVETDEDQTLPYVGLEHIEPWRGTLLSVGDPMTSGVANRFSKGQVLFSKLRPYLAKAFIADHEGLCSTELLPLVPGSVINRFLLYVLLSRGFVDLVDSSTYGSKMPRANWDFIGSQTLVIPRPPEQRQIADFLDRETAKIDELIAKKRELIERLKEKRTALISHVVTKGLPPEEAAKLGLPVNPPLKPSGVPWLGDVPQHWKTIKATRGFRVIGSGTTPKADDPDNYGGEVHWVTTSELREKVITETKQYVSDKALAEYSALKIYPVGTALIAMYGATIGRLGMLGVEATLNQACCAYAYPLGLSAKFMYYWLWMRRPILISLSVGGGQPNLSQDDLRQLWIPAPDLTEQTRIVEFLDRETAKLDKLADVQEQTIERLQEHRSALITAAVTGKIDVREQVAS